MNPERIIMMITGVDYYFETSYSFIELSLYFNEKVKSVWPDYYKCDCSDDNSSDFFYAKDRSMFDLMDDRGYYLDKNDEGPFLLMFGKKGVTLVLPDTIESSLFCKKIFDIVACKLNVSAQKNY